MADCGLLNGKICDECKKLRGDGAISDEHSLKNGIENGCLDEFINKSIY